MALIIGKKNITELLKKRIKKHSKGWISLIEIPTEKHMDINTEALRILINEMKYNCIYITLSNPFNKLNKLFKSKGVNIDNLFFIDAISKMYGIKKNSNKKCVYISRPFIDSINPELNKILVSSSLKKKKNIYIFLDSITALLLYNSLSQTIKFSQAFTKTLKKAGTDGLIVSTAKGATTEKLIEKLSKSCNEIIDIR